jgi:hypothetical protein
MSKSDAIDLSEVLNGGPVAWPKPDDHEEVLKHIARSGAKIVYEDDHVVAFEEDDDEREGAKIEGEHRITVMPKKAIASLLDLNVTDGQTAAHLLYGVQQVAFKLGLQNTGFEIRENVLPPYQRRPQFRLKIRYDPMHAAKAAKEPKELT